MSDDPKPQQTRTPAPQPDDDKLIAEMLAPPPVEQAQTSVDFWRKQRRELPLHRRAARREAEQKLAEAEAQLRASRRVAYGPTLLEQLSETVGITISPARLRRIVVMTVLTLLVAVIGILVAAVAFWPQIEPIVRFFIGGGGGGGEGGG